MMILFCCLFTNICFTQVGYGVVSKNWSVSDAQLEAGEGQRAGEEDDPRGALTGAKVKRA